MIGQHRLRRLYPRTLRGRLALIALVTSVLWIAVLTTVFNLALDRRLHAQADEVLRTRAEAVAATVDARPDGRLTVREPAEDQALDAGVWIYEGGRAIELPPNVPSALQRQADALVGRGTRFAETTSPSATRFYALPVAAPPVAGGGSKAAGGSGTAGGGEASGGGQAGTVVTSVSLDPYVSTADTALAGSIALSLVLLGGVYLLTRLVVRRALRPVGDMSAQAAEWSKAGVAERFGEGSRPAELVSLAANLDELLDRLAAVLRHEQRQAADISHELRTPLARITAETEWLARRPRTADEQRASHEAIASAAATMGRICETLLSEARTRTGQTPGSCDVLALAYELARRGTDGPPRTPVIEVRGGPATAGVSAALAERILSPLLDNARRYAAHTVLIECAAVAGTVRVTVADDGPGVPEEFRDSLFEPGRRATPGDGHDGAGLGLALARRLARAAGGDIALDAGHAGARFSVTLPAG
ncbi:ATP-binding protein [Streptomyces sp. NPDC059743]|uniref:ATP-binding protein n=1 Tax=Streptomyces sp. NPDC059743 TaxID=3346928 RepID=UPI003663547F